LGINVFNIGMVPVLLSLLTSILHVCFFPNNGFSLKPESIFHNFEGHHP